MSINLTKLTDNLNIISSLADQPTLSATELKAKFDEAGNIIKDYINNILIDGLNEALETIDSLKDNILDEAVDKIYPVGSVMYSSNSANPSTYLGVGTWESYASGKFLVGYSSSDSDFGEDATGGSKTVSLKASNIPSLTIGTCVTGVTSNSIYTADLTYNQGPVISGVGVTTGTLKYTNSSQTSVEILPPYQVVYIWERTA